MDELLKILKSNALESPANIARMLDLSEDEVKQRITEYEKQGIIRGYQAVVNEDRLDLRELLELLGRRDGIGPQGERDA